METEDKYASLSLAFRTDQQTLQERVLIHQRAKDLAEENHQTELEQLRDTVYQLSGYCADPEIRAVVGKLHEHVAALTQTSVHLTRQSELQGSVQQENKLSETIDIMLQYVDNLKLLYEKEHSELEETRKLVDNRILQGDSELTRRSISMANASKGAKRRVSTATPRLMALSSSITTSDEEGAAMSPTFRFPPTTSLPSSPTLKTHRSQSPAKLKLTEKTTMSDSTEKEEIFQKGLEQGLRISVSQELCELREQQTAFCDTLESLMDKNQGPEHEEFDMDHLDVLEKIWSHLPAWRESLFKIRMLSAIVVLLLAVLIFKYTMSLNSEVSAKKMQ